MNRVNKRVFFIVLLLVTILASILIFCVVVSSQKADNLREQLSLGEKYLDELDYQKAIAAYKEAIEIDPQNEEAYLGLANAYVAMGKYDKAVKVLKSFEGESDDIEEEMDLILLLIEQEEEAEVSSDSEIINGEVTEENVSDDNEWREVYKAFLSELSGESELTGDFFYVDDDNIPEIIIDYKMGPVLYKYYQGNVVEIYKSQADGLGAIFTFEKKSAFAIFFGDEGAMVYDFYKMNEDGSTEQLAITYESFDYGYDYEYEYQIREWYIDNIQVTRNEYYSKLKEMNDTYGELKGGFDYSKSVSELIGLLDGEEVIPQGQEEYRELYSEQSASDSNKENNDAAHILYNMVLFNAENGLYHDGSVNDFYVDSYIKYSYADIDNDSIDELIISNSSSFTVGSATYIYDYDLSTNSVIMIFDGGLYVSIYENGIITSDSDNNSSLGLLWPFSIYRCNTSGVYEYETYVSSWDVEYGDYYNGDSFPYEVDADGNGVVYELYDGYMDDSEFDSWYNNNLSEDLKINLVFFDL